jgi:hypothetical protein
MKRSALSLGTVLLISILTLSACRRHTTAPSQVPHLINENGSGVTISSPSRPAGSWVPYGIGEFLFSYPSEWQTGQLAKVNGGVEIPFFGAEGTAVAIIDCPIVKDAYPAPSKKESRAFSRQGIDYGVDLWTGPSTAALLFHIGDLAHWKDDDHAKRSCQLIAVNADDDLKATFKKILESAH